MKLSKFQIIVLLLLVWLYTNSKGGGLITPTPFVPQLEGADLEAKVLAAMIVIADDHKPKVLPTAVKDVPIEEEILPEQSAVDEVELFPGRYPRAIVLTDTINCGPCRDYDRNTINIFRTKTWQDSGWSVGNEATNMVEIVDLPKEGDKFYNYFDKLSEVRKDISPSTPTTVFINSDGTLRDVRIGKISHSEFVRLCKPPVVKSSSLDAMSHKEMIKLHNQFHGGGNWKWPGDLKSHLATTHGVK